MDDCCYWLFPQILITLLSMTVTENKLSEHCLLPCSRSIQVSTILIALNLDTLHNHVRKLCSHWHWISVCVYPQLFRCSGLLLPFEKKRKDKSPFESWIKIAKLWWTSKPEHWSTEDVNSCFVQAEVPHRQRQFFFFSFLSRFALFCPSKCVERNI